MIRICRCVQFPLAFLFLTVATTCSADLALHALFTDHAVLQSGQTVPVWGTADPGQSVSVTFAGQTLETQAAGDGGWMVKLAALAQSSDSQTLTATSGDESVSVSDVLVGEVWVCSGQSNMAMALRNTDDSDLVTKEADDGKLNLIRLFKAPVRGADDRADSVDAQWTTTTVDTAGAFSAVGMYFGRSLARRLDCPVGLIQSANGGTNAYSWINSDTLENDPVAKSTRDYWTAAMKSAPAAMKRFATNRAKWTSESKAAKAAGKPFTARAPREPMNAGHVKRPAGHYNAMIAPLQPYAIKGAIWYQGEANSRPPFCTQYRDLMLALVEDWRADWATAADEPGQDFPFYLVQLPNYANGHAQGWPIIREQMQQFGTAGSTTGSVTTIDVGDPTDIHPKNKLPVGNRLARLAAAKTYGHDVVFSGPVYKSNAAVGNQITILLEHADGLSSLDGQPLRHFQIAGADGVFVDAQAVITGETLLVSASTVAKPQAVRYAWTNNPEHPNLVNGEELPASPFRTDHWEIEVE